MSNSALVIVGGAALVAMLVVVAAWEHLHRAFVEFVKRFADRLDIAGLTVKPEELAMLLVPGAACVWILLIMFLHASPLIGLLLLPLSGVLILYAANSFVNLKVNRRRNAFLQQLELALRMLAGALRAGLGFRQALILVSEEIGDPAREEFTRVIGRTNIGVDLHDALAILAHRMPSVEMSMMIRAIEAQTSTGGDLAKVLESLANTIRERRRIHRKIMAMTSEGRMTGWVVGALPVVVGILIMIIQPSYRTSLVATTPGHTVLAIASGLEIGAAFMIAQIMRIDV